MRDRRPFVIFGFIAWWIVLGVLITGFPIKNGQQVMYPPDKGLGPNPYVGEDIKNVQRFSMKDFTSFMFGNQPSRGPKGTTFDQVNRRKEIPPMATVVHDTTRFGCAEMVEGFYGPVNPQKVQLPSAEELTQFIKDAGKYFGAVDVAIADLGPNPAMWFWEDDSFGYQIEVKPEEHRYAIVFALEEKNSTHPYPTAVNLDSLKYYSKQSKGYWDDDYVAGHLAEMIRMMGYHAWGHNNSFVRSVPLAVLAGMGEYARFGNMITLNWGSNVRLSSVTTDLPLIAGHPIDIGVHDFCNMCTRCYDYCPTQAIPRSEMDFMGVHKYVDNLWKCRRATVVGLKDLTDASTCTICRDVCPYVKDTAYLGNKIGRIIVSRSHIGRRFLLNLDYLLYSQWNKHGIGEITKQRRERLREVSLKYPEGDWCQEWLGKGAASLEARRSYRQKNPAGILAVAKGGIGIVHPFYSKEDLADPNFGKWPSWVDPWGRFVAGYEQGEPGAPRLDLRPTVRVIGTAVLSGVGGSPMGLYTAQGLTPEEAKKQVPATWPGSGYETATNPFSNAYAW
ncbi:MAG: reductive dehalogenase domain-containing protein [Syntrophobacteraceae bacterium]|jgi:reductive dehalogenase